MAESDGGFSTVANAFCVPGGSCRNRCGVCPDCNKSGNNNNNVNNNVILNNDTGTAGMLRLPRAPPDASWNVSSNCDAPAGGVTCTIGECGKTTLCHKCHGGRDDKPEACPVCHPPRLSCGPGVCQVLVDCGTCCETPPDFKAAFPKIAYSGVGPFQLAVCGPIAGKIAAKKLGLDCVMPSPQLEEK